MSGSWVRSGTTTGTIQWLETMAWDDARPPEQQDFIHHMYACWQETREKPTAKMRLSIAGNAGKRVLSSLGFAIAHHTVKTQRHALVVILTPRLETEPAPVCHSSLGDGEELDRIWFKYLEGGADAAWFCNNVHRWQETALPKPTLLLLDGWLGNMAEPATTLLLKLFDDAASHLAADAVVVANSSASCIRRFFPAHARVDRDEHDDIVVDFSTAWPASSAVVITPVDDVAGSDDDRHTRARRQQLCGRGYLLLDRGTRFDFTFRPARPSCKAETNVMSDGERPSFVAQVQ